MRIDESRAIVMWLAIAIVCVAIAVTWVIVVSTPLPIGAP